MLISKERLNQIHNNKRLSYEQLNHLDVPFTAKQLLIAIDSFNCTKVKPTIEKLSIYLATGKEEIQKDAQTLIDNDLMNENLILRSVAIIANEGRFAI